MFEKLLLLALLKATVFADNGNNDSELVFVVKSAPEDDYDKARWGTQDESIAVAANIHSHFTIREVGFKIDEDGKLLGDDFKAGITSPDGRLTLREEDEGNTSGGASGGGSDGGTGGASGGASGGGSDGGTGGASGGGSDGGTGGASGGGSDGASGGASGGGSGTTTTPTTSTTSGTANTATSSSTSKTNSPTTTTSNPGATTSDGAANLFGPDKLSGLVGVAIALLI